MIDIMKCLLVEVPDQGGELTASMNLSVRQQRDKIEGGAAAKAGAAAKKVVLLPLQFDIDQAIFDGHDWVGAAGFEVVDNKAVIFVRAG